MTTDPDQTKSSIRARFSHVFQPDEAYLLRSSTSARTKDEYLPFAVGILSFSLAFFVAYLDELFGVGCARDSISHYYYAPVAGPFFIMTLAFVSAFMLAYRGQSKLDGWTTSIGGLSALAVAAFPTSGLGCRYGQMFDHRLTQLNFGQESGAGYDAVDRPAFEGLFSTTQDIGGQTYLVANETSQLIHMIGAIGLIGSLIFLSFVHLNRKKWIGNISDKGGRNERIVGWKERFFTCVCLVLMIAGAILVGLQNTPVAKDASTSIAGLLSVIRTILIGKDYSDFVRPVYHGELLALVGFGSAWLVQWWNYWAWLDRLPFLRRA